MRKFEIRVTGDSADELEEEALAAAQDVFCEGTILEIDQNYTISPQSFTNDGLYWATIRVHEVPRDPEATDE